MEFRETTIDDVLLLTKFRIQQLIDAGNVEGEDITEVTKKYFKSQFESNSIFGFLCYIEGAPVASGSVSLCLYPPSWKIVTGEYAYLHGVFTLPEHRGKGIAKKIVDLLMEEIKSRGYQVVNLQASKYGRGMYEKMGFVQQDGYMVLRL